MKRFYKLVSITDIDGGFGIALDGKSVKTPASKNLVVETRAVAELLMAEWAAQEKNIVPDAMPANQLVMTALDRVHGREDTIKHIIDYIDTDLVFYRSEAEPYKTRQAELWDGWIKKLEKKFNVKLVTTDQIESLGQDKNFVKDFNAYLAKLSDIKLTVFESLIDDTSSPVLAYAFFEEGAVAEDLYKAVLVEDLIRAEIYDEDKYGAAPDQEKKRITLRRNLEAAEKLLSLI